jgi:hypothetical protein
VTRAAGALALAAALAASIAGGSASADDRARPRVRVVDLHVRGWLSADELTSTLRASMSAGEVDLTVVDAPARLPAGGEDVRAGWARRIAVAERADAVLWAEAGPRGRFEATLWVLDATGSEPRLANVRVRSESAFDAHRTLALTARSMLRDALQLPATETTSAEAIPAPRDTPRGPPRAVAPRPGSDLGPFRAAMGPVARQNGSLVLGWRATAGLRLPAGFGIHAGVDLLREDEGAGGEVRRRRVPVWVAASRHVLTGEIGLRAEVRGGLAVTDATRANGVNPAEFSSLAFTAGASVVLRVALGDEIAAELPLGLDARLATTGDGGEADRAAPLLEGSLGLMLALGAP